MLELTKVQISTKNEPKIPKNTQTAKKSKKIQNKLVLEHMFSLYTFLAKKIIFCLNFSTDLGCAHLGEQIWVQSCLQTDTGGDKSTGRGSFKIQHLPVLHFCTYKYHLYASSHCTIIPLNIEILCCKF